MHFTGLEIEPQLVKTARERVGSSTHQATFVQGDITQPPASLGKFDYVLCLNNTLGFISDYQLALRRMSELGRAYISVFGEEFNDRRAQDYFASVGMKIEHISGDEIAVRDVGTVRRFPRSLAEN